MNMIITKGFMRMSKEYTDIYKGYQIRDCTYLNEPPKDIPITFDVVRWKYRSKPVKVIDAETGKDKMVDKYCYSVAHIVYDEREDWFDFKSIGLRWLEEHPDKDVENWIVDWCKYKVRELRENDSKM